MSDATKPPEATRLFSVSVDALYDTSEVVWTSVGDAIAFDALDVWRFTCWGDAALKKQEG